MKVCKGSLAVVVAVSFSFLGSNAFALISTDQIADGAVTDVKITGPISGSKIADGSVTDAKIAGQIARSRVEKPANVIVVAKSGGDFSSIQAAMNSISPGPSDPYLIQVMPGTYSENVVMKSYVHLQGAGCNLTVLTASPGGSVVSANAVAGAIISDMSISGGNYAVFVGSNSAITVSRNCLSESTYDGIQTAGYSTTVISDNTISNNGQHGITVASGRPTIINNTITGNVHYGIFVNAGVSAPAAIVQTNDINNNGWSGIGLWSSAAITNNVLSENGWQGIEVNTFASSLESNTDKVTISGNIISNNSTNGIASGYYTRPVIVHNTITGNASDDIQYPSQSRPFISFNVYDTIGSGNTAVGQYNLKTDGTAAPI